VIDDQITFNDESLPGGADYSRSHGAKLREPNHI
jgi:hypothetical protein